MVVVVLRSDRLITLTESSPWFVTKANGVAPKEKLTKLNAIRRVKYDSIVLFMVDYRL
jgi:hypothetical protein